MTAVVALKVAAVAAATTVTDAGTVRVGLVLDRVTEAPPAGAGLVRVTVHVLEALEVRLPALHWSEDTVGRVAGPVTVNSSIMTSLESYQLKVRYWYAPKSKLEA